MTEIGKDRAFRATEPKKVREVGVGGNRIIAAGLDET